MMAGRSAHEDGGRGGDRVGRVAVGNARTTKRTRLSSTSPPVLQTKMSVPARRAQFECPAARRVTSKCGQLDASLRAQWPGCFAFFVFRVSGGRTENPKMAPKRCWVGGEKGAGFRERSKVGCGIATEVAPQVCLFAAAECGCRRSGHLMDVHAGHVGLCQATHPASAASCCALLDPANSFLP